MKGRNGKRKFSNNLDLAPGLKLRVHFSSQSKTESPVKGQNKDRDILVFNLNSYNRQRSPLPKAVSLVLRMADKN